MTHTLTGRYPLGSLEGRPGQLRFVPSTTIVGADNIILPAPVLVDLDTDGAFSVDLVGTDDADYAPSGWVWTVEERLDGGRPAWSFELTADSDLSDLASTSPPGSYVTLVPTSRVLTAGAGLTGGGTLAADRSFAVGAGTGISVTADAVAVDTAVIATQADLAAHAGDTTGIHGITDTAALETTGHAAKHAAAGSDPVTVAESQVTGLTAALAGKMSATLLDAQSLLYAVADDTPAALVVASSRFVGRKASGDLGAMTVAEAKTLLALAVADITGAAPTASPTLTGTVTVPTPAAGSATTVAASTLWAVERATVGNLLTAAQATPSTGAWTLSGCTEAAGLVLTATGSALCSAAATVVQGIAVGQVMTMMADLAPVGRSAATRISWRNSGGAEISAVAGDTIAAGATGTSMAVGVAPAGTVSAIVYAAYSSTGATSDTVTVTKPSYHAGYSGSWVLPGVPVPNLGRRARRPLTDDLHVTVWSDAIAAPATARYDSGIRQVASWGTDGVVTTVVTLTNIAPTAGVAGHIRCRRVGPWIVWQSRGATFSTGATISGAAIAGFLPSESITFVCSYFGGNTYAQATNVTMYFPAHVDHAQYATSWRFEHYAASVPTALPGTLVATAPLA